MSTVPAPCCTSRWHRQCSKKSSHSIVHFGVHPLKSKNESVAQWVKLGKNVGSQRWPLNIKLGHQDIFLVATHSRPLPQLLLKRLLFVGGAVELEDRLTGVGTAEMEDLVTTIVAVVPAVIGYSGRV